MKQDISTIPYEEVKENTELPVVSEHTTLQEHIKAGDLDSAWQMVVDGKAKIIGIDTYNNIAKKAKERNTILAALQLFAAGVAPLTQQYGEIKSYFKEKKNFFQNLSEEQKEKVKTQKFNQLSYEEQLGLGNSSKVQIPNDALITYFEFDKTKLWKQVAKVASEALMGEEDVLAKIPIVHGVMEVIHSEENIFSKIDFKPLQEIFVASMANGETDLSMFSKFAEEISNLNHIEIKE